MKVADYNLMADDDESECERPLNGTGKELVRFECYSI